LQPKAAAPATQPVPAAPVMPGENDEVELPLPPILEKMPPDLRDRLTMPIEALTNASISIPANQIMPQLASGAVRIEFGQLRAAAANLFDVGSEFDSIAITLPLDVVLARLNRRWLARGSGQKKMESPREIGSVFLRRSDVIVSPGPVQKPAPAPTQDTQIRLRMTLISPTPAPGPTGTTFRRATPAPAPTSTPAPAPAAIQPAMPLPPAEPPKPAAPIAFSPATPRPATPTEPPKPVATSIPFPNTPISRPPTPAATPVAPAPSRPAASLEVPSGSVVVPLAALMEKWPEALRNEIVQLGLGNSQLILPVSTLEEGMKRGIVTFFWRDLRTYIRPKPVTGVSINDGAAVEMSLKVIAPLFVAARASTARPKYNAQFDKSIPNVFTNALAPKMEEPPAPAAPVAAPMTMAPAPAPIAAPKMAPPAAPISPIAVPVETRAPAPPEASTSFASARPKMAEPQGMESSKRPVWTPSEVIRRTMDLKGVEGAMVVLHDGLMVACELPPYLNSEIAAAFLPQIYNRLGQCIDELHMGPLSHLRFNVGNVSWLVFRQTSIYFAVFGREGDLPAEAQLAPLAAELDRSRH
jgi:predicted regulator of Ras-like GTPase activity (Roadblock/LC7/MglB family)